jgi:hypothetical protein
MSCPNPLLPGERANKEGLLIVTIGQLALLHGLLIAGAGRPPPIATGRTPASHTSGASRRTRDSAGCSPTCTGFPTPSFRERGGERESSVSSLREDERYSSYSCQHTCGLTDATRDYGSARR